MLAPLAMGKFVCVRRALVRPRRSGALVSGREAASVNSHEPPRRERGDCGHCTVGGGPAGYRSLSFAQASQRYHAVSNCALASLSVAAWPPVRMSTGLPKMPCGSQNQRKVRAAFILLALGGCQNPSRIQAADGAKHQP
jgi:hypothetical protein